MRTSALPSLDIRAIRRLRDHLVEVATRPIRPQEGAPMALSASPEEEAALRRFRPFAELFYLVAKSDGKIDEEEQLVIRGAFLTLTAGRISRERMSELEGYLLDRCSSADVDERMESICSELASDREDAELAFSLAGAVALANESVSPEEQSLLNELASWLRISPARIENLYKKGRLTLPPPAVSF